MEFTAHNFAQFRKIENRIQEKIERILGEWIEKQSNMYKYKYLVWFPFLLVLCFNLA